MMCVCSDFTVKVVDVESSSHKVYRGHKAPVLSVVLHPSQPIVVGLHFSQSLFLCTSHPYSTVSNSGPARSSRLFFA
jgi:hypothetical protein